MQTKTKSRPVPMWVGLAIVGAAIAASPFLAVFVGTVIQ